MGLKQAPLEDPASDVPLSQDVVRDDDDDPTREEAVAGLVGSAVAGLTLVDGRGRWRCVTAPAWRRPSIARGPPGEGCR